ncbi:hypothetical protein [Nocardioides convexus]|uniref:hypothetical protein n=1 Tax=Nocardioides convexus TaxID=2712224 RepID=UPI0024187F06|nr:hypothetical protein [Nocardioides convexus]
MSHELISLAVLAVVFLVATVRGVNMGALALVASFVVGLAVYDATTEDVLAGFPSGLFVILVGVTYLFALAKNNGTVDWIVHAAVRAVGGRVALVPWAMFFVCAVVTAIGAVSPAAVAIVAPVAMGFALRYRIHPVMMGMMVVQGATAGSLLPHRHLRLDHQRRRRHQRPAGQPGRAVRDHLLRRHPDRGDHLPRLRRTPGSWPAGGTPSPWGRWATRPSRRRTPPRTASRPRPPLGRRGAPQHPQRRPGGRDPAQPAALAHPGRSGRAHGRRARLRPRRGLHRADDRGDPHPGLPGVSQGCGGEDQPGAPSCSSAASSPT